MCEHSRQITWAMSTSRYGSLDAQIHAFEHRQSEEGRAVYDSRTYVWLYFLKKKLLGAPVSIQALIWKTDSHNNLSGWVRLPFLEQKSTPFTAEALTAVMQPLEVMLLTRADDGIYTSGEPLPRDTSSRRACRVSFGNQFTTAQLRTLLGDHSK